MNFNLKKVFDINFIDAKEIEYLGVTALDKLGRVFKFKNEVYRGIYFDKVDYVKSLFDSGLISELIDSNYFIETEITSFFSEDFPLILKHKSLTPTFPTEWTFSMLKDAAITILEVNRICNKFGYELWDGHPYNISFDGVKPKWIDFGSISLKNDVWRGKDEFLEHTIVPLVFLQRNHLLEGYSILAAEKNFKIAAPSFRETYLFEKFLEIIGENKVSVNSKIFERKWIEDFCKIEKLSDSFWGDYQVSEKTLVEDLNPHNQNRFNRFFELANLVSLHANDARSTLDLAGNVGLASLVVRNQNPRISKSINTDYDYNSIEKSYLFLKSHPEFSLESYILNFMLPMHDHITRFFRSDIVFALAITHHLILTQGYNISEILSVIKRFSNKYVFIEFMPLGLWGGDPNSKPEIPDWYNSEWFEKKFRKQFDFIAKQILESHEINGIDEPHRVLFIGRVK